MCEAALTGLEVGFRQTAAGENRIGERYARCLVIAHLFKGIFVVLRFPYGSNRSGMRNYLRVSSNVQPNALQTYLLLLLRLSVSPVPSNHVS